MEEEDFFGAQDEEGERRMRALDLDATEHKLREAGFRDAVAAERDRERSENFRRGFDHGVAEGDKLGYWLGVVGAMQLMRNVEGVKFDDSDERVMRTCRGALKKLCTVR
mmetsp:Transcript_6648/g.20132  ORF Transcript_6648/g.20132 Transcript_6648/m.20132 type:complete len:109 (+) Transcript_6648:940-1266(+)